MGFISFDNDGYNPLDVLEEMANLNDWLGERASGTELCLSLPGRWYDYQLYFVWQPEDSALLVSSHLGLKIKPERQQEVNNLLALVNQRLWLGYFTVMSEDTSICFRHTLMLRHGLAAESMEDLLEAALTECDRYYPAFHMVLNCNASANDAHMASLFETVGEA